MCCVYQKRAYFLSYLCLLNEFLKYMVGFFFSFYCCDVRKVSWKSRKGLPCPLSQTAVNNDKGIASTGNVRNVSRLHQSASSSIRRSERRKSSRWGETCAVGLSSGLRDKERPLNSTATLTLWRPPPPVAEQPRGVLTSTARLVLRGAGKNTPIWAHAHTLQKKVQPHKKTRISHPAHQNTHTHTHRVT